MRVAVTGSTGFVGAAVAASLAREDHEVVGFSRSAPGGLDLGDVHALAERFAGFDAVVHAAGTGNTRAPERVLGWLEVAATENVARAARAAGVRRFVVLSSIEASLGTSRRRSVDESYSDGPAATLFGRIARAKEETAIALGTPRFEPVVLRAGRLYGAGDRFFAPMLVKEARQLGGVRLVGRPLSFVATTAVANLAHGVGRALVAPKAAHGVYHVVDRELSTQVSFFELLSDALGLRAPSRGHALLVERLLARLGRGLGDDDAVLRRGVDTTVDSKHAHEELGYEPVVSLTEGIDALARWVVATGGADAVLAAVRATPDEASIAELLRGAGR